MVFSVRQMLNHINEVSPLPATLEDCLKIQCSYPVAELKLVYLARQI